MVRGLRAARLGEDLEQLVVGEEEEAREGEPLRVEVLIQPLLDLLEEAIGVGQLTPQIGLQAHAQRVAGAQRPGHRLPPQRIDGGEAACLVRQVLRDVL